LDELANHKQTQHNSAAYVCEMENCDRIGMNGFENVKAMKLHLKKDHPSPFQCERPGCDRVGKKGWMRERDMVKHMKKVHEISE
jgi:general transcription factor IIIA